MNPLLILKGLDFARIGMWLLVGLAIGFSIWFHGYMKGSAKLDHYMAEQAKEGARIVVKRGEVTTKVVTKYVKVAGATKTVTEFIDREVKVYAQENPANMCLDGNWIRLHDIAAANELPKPPRIPSGVLREAKTDSGNPYSLASTNYRYQELRQSP